MNNTKKDMLKKLFENTSFESFQYEDYDNAEDLIESLRTQISEDEVIYYSNAIKYLSENDAILKESLSIASELGYSVDSINSELLATLLQQRNMEEELSELTPEIEEIFEKSEE